LCCHPAEAAQLIPSSLAAQYWMLAGAGAKLDGPGAGLRVAGLASIYCKVFGVWLDDDTPGLDRTMAALDRRLKNGEEWLARGESGSESSSSGPERSSGPSPGSSASTGSSAMGVSGSSGASSVWP